MWHCAPDRLRWCAPFPVVETHRKREKNVHDRKMRGITAAAVGVMALVFGMAPTASAYTQYTYTGNNYASASGIYTTAMSQSGAFTLDIDLGANLSDVNITSNVTSFTVFDGVNTYTELDLPLFSDLTDFVVATDASGDIVTWALDLIGGDVVFASCNNPGFVLTTDPGSYCNGFAQADLVQNNTTLPVSLASTVGAPGTWVGIVPEPNTALLLAMGLGGLGWRGRAKQA